jgi:hypothetical protein
VWLRLTDWLGISDYTDPLLGIVSGRPLIPAGSDQEVHVAVTRFRTGEEGPTNYRALVNGESLSGASPVFWYSAFGHRPRDTFFSHGGFFQP